MEREDIKKLLFILQQAYPSTYKNMSNDEKREQIDFYLVMFGAYEIQIVMLALKNYIKENQYPPTVAGIIEQIRLLTNEDTDSELWNLVANACKNGYYNFQKEFNRLPKVCQMWLGSPEALRELSLLKAEILNTVTRGQFLKSVQEIKKQNEARTCLPNELKELIEKREVDKQYKLTCGL